MEAPSTKPHNADVLLEMLGVFRRHIYIFRHHFAHILQVASAERPAMPTSVPLLNALEVEKSAPRDKEAIERNHPHYKDAAQASNRKNAAATPGAAPEANQGGNSSAPLGK